MTEDVAKYLVFHLQGLYTCTHKRHLLADPSADLRSHPSSNKWTPSGSLRSRLESTLCSRVVAGSVCLSGQDAAPNASPY